MTPGPRPTVAAFDFDGTLTPRDTLVPFLRQVGGGARFARDVVLAAAHARPRPGDDARRDRFKLDLVRRTFGGRSSAEIERLGTDYAARILENLRTPVVDELRRHQGAGHRTVIVSASLEPYLEPVRRELGVDGLCCVRLEVAPDGTCTGATTGPNVRRMEKVRLLRAWMDEHVPDGPGEVWAYGDSAGDTELLDLADHAVWV